MIALLGNLSRDLFPGRPPRVGGAPFHAARALRSLHVPARIYARCALDDRDELLPPVVALGTPVALRAGRGDRELRDRLRRRAGERCGSARSATPGCPDDVPLLPGRCAGCTSRRSPAPTSRPRRSPRSRAAGGSRSTARGSCGRRGTGELELDADYDPDVLRHVWVLKLTDEEAEVLGDPAALAGARGARHPRLARRDRLRGRAESSACRRSPIERRPDRRRRRLLVAYVAGRAAGLAPGRGGAPRDGGRRRPCSPGR